MPNYHIEQFGDLYFGIVDQIDSIHYECITKKNMTLREAETKLLELLKIE